MAYAEGPGFFKTLLLMAVFVSGCGTLGPVSQRPQDGADTLSGTGGVRRVLVSSGDDLLPKPSYTASGEAVPYVPQPNPYLGEHRPVPAPARERFAAAVGMLDGGDLQAARSRFEALTREFPGLSGPWVKLGVIAERQDDIDRAVQCYEKALTVNDSNVNAYLALAMAQRKVGRFVEARQTYLQALSRWKDFPEAHLNLGILYDLYLNEPTEAQKHYEAYLFLAGDKDDTVRKWLVEVRRRTGIDRSFIERPPQRSQGTLGDGAVEGGAGDVDEEAG